jgi:hypothetical protein
VEWIGWGTSGFAGSNSALTASTLLFSRWLSRPVFLLALRQGPPVWYGCGKFTPIYITRHHHNANCGCLHLVSVRTLISFHAIPTSSVRKGWLPEFLVFPTPRTCPFSTKRPNFTTELFCISFLLNVVPSSHPIATNEPSHVT